MTTLAECRLVFIRYLLGDQVGGVAEDGGGVVDGCGRCSGDAFRGGVV